MNGKTWTITDGNGVKHDLGIDIKVFGGPEIKVDSNTYKIKSSNWFVNVIDYSVDFPGANCHIVMIGKNARLAVNGTYTDDQSTYEPVNAIPAWVWVLVALSVLGGWFFGGLICAAIGCAFSTIYISSAMQKSPGKAIGAFVGFLVIAALFFAVNMMMLQ